MYKGVEEFRSNTDGKGGVRSTSSPGVQSVAKINRGRTVLYVLSRPSYSEKTICLTLASKVVGVLKGK